MKNKALISLLLLLSLTMGGCTLRLAPVREPTPSPSAAPTAAPTAAPAPEATPEPAGTSTPEPEELPESFPMTLMFSSGAGGWGTELDLQRDGSFQGRYHDSEMGDAGEAYPNGSVYVCVFSGAFTDIRRQEDGTWSMRLSELASEDVPGKEWIDDGVRFITADPYGLETAGSGEFRLYPPEIAVAGLSEELLSWWPGRFDPEGPPETLGCWGLENVDTGGGFFSYG